MSLLGDRRHERFVTVVDDAHDLRDARGDVYLWRGSADIPGAVSLIAYVEAHGVELRQRYLAWVNDVGVSLVGTRSLVEHLALDDDFSFWWMTLIVEQNPWKSPAISDALRLLALDTLFAEAPPAGVRLVSGDRRLHRAIGDLCRRLRISFEPVARATRDSRPLGRQIYARLPWSVRGVIALVRSLRLRWRLRQSHPRWFVGPDSVMFCSYFDNVDAGAARDGRFVSEYWTGLDRVLANLGRTRNWVHLFVPDAAIPLADARAWVTGFNEARDYQGAHAFLDRYLSWSIVVRAALRWCRLAVRSLKVTALEDRFRPSGAACTFWHLLADDWAASTRGPFAWQNLLWFELFDAALADMPRQSTGLYLAENQAWERAFIRAWRRHGHGRLLGVVHSTVRFWDLRFFRDARTIDARGCCAMPQPDEVVLNGAAAIETVRQAEYPLTNVVEAEALRYTYLERLQVQADRKSGDATRLRLLVLCDQDESSTQKLLGTLREALARVDRAVDVIVKTHPNLPSVGVAGLRARLTTEPLVGLLGASDVACATSVTSASLDAYLAGLPVVILLDGNDLNYSPLRGRPDVAFVAGPADMADALHAAADGVTHPAPVPSFFSLDPALPKWSKILARESESKS